MNNNPRKFAAQNAIITGICTFIICAVIYIFLVRSETLLTAVPLDVSIGLFTTSFICALLQIPQRKKAAKAGLMPIVDDIHVQAAYIWLPENSAFFCFVMAVFATCIYGFLPVGIIFAFAPGFVFTRVGYILFKSVMSGMAAGYAVYHANFMVPYLIHKKNNQ